MTLQIAAEGCCKGHPCDNCKTCQRGRCCRRDNPDYRLPELGEWDGPIYGKLGVFREDGSRAECHICGGWYVSLGSHVQRKHGLLASEYKSIFGLMSKQALSSSELRSKMSELLAEHCHQMRPVVPVLPTPEQLSAFRKRQRPRLQEQMDPKIAEGRKRAHLKTSATLKRRCASGELSPAKHLADPNIHQRSIATRLAHQQADPEWWADRNRRIVETRQKRQATREAQTP